MTADSDLIELVEAARGGEDEARDRLLRAVLPELRGFVRLNAGQHIRDRESAADLAQSVCRELLQDLNGFRGDHGVQFKKWLYTLALRKILHRSRYYRAERRDVGRELANDEDALLACYASVCTPSHHAAVREEVARVEAAFDKLSDDDRRVLTLSCLVGLSHREIAAEMERSEAAVRKQLSRARARLSLALIDEPADTD